jgi:hypothetical protein
MSDLMVVLVNGAAVIEYDRSKPLSGKQQEYLDLMDQKMDTGIKLGSETVVTPSQQQRAQYVAFTLLSGIQNDDEALIAAMSSYLADRFPELKQVRADMDDKGEKIMFDLIFDQEHKNQVKVSFNS